jgi:hypothetical protein
MLKKTLMIRTGKRSFICSSIILLILTVLAPLITYSYLTNSYDLVIDSYTNKEKDLQQQVNGLTEQNIHLNQEKSQLTNLTQPYLFTRIGWYLHKSNDPVSSSKNTFTIYGRIYNIGQLPSNNTELTVRFYGSNETLLQTSTIRLGAVLSITNSTAPFDMPFDIEKQNIACSVADAVTDVDISLRYQ